MLSGFSHVWLCATLWTRAFQASLHVGVSRQEHWSRFPCSPPGDLPNPRVEPAALISPALAGGFFTTSTTWEAQELEGTAGAKLKQATQEVCKANAIDGPPQLGLLSEAATWMPCLCKYSYSPHLFSQATPRETQSVSNYKTQWCGLVSASLWKPLGLAVAPVSVLTKEMRPNIYTPKMCCCFLLLIFVYF